MTSLKRNTAMAVLHGILVTVAFASPAYAGTDVIEVVAPRPHILTDYEVQSISTGMTGREVLAKIGAPERKVRFERSSTTAWDYAHHGAFGAGEYSVILDDNDIVVSRIVIGASLKGE